MEAVAYLKKNDYDFEQIDVRADPAKLDEMMQIFGVTLAPSMITEDGLKLADFGVEELVPFLKKHDL